MWSLWVACKEWLRSCWGDESHGCFGFFWYVFNEVRLGKIWKPQWCPPEIRLAGGVLVFDLSATLEKSTRLFKLSPRRLLGRVHLFVPRRFEILPSRHHFLVRIWETSKPSIQTSKTLLTASIILRLLWRFLQCVRIYYRLLLQVFDTCKTYDTLLFKLFASSYTLTRFPFPLLNRFFIFWSFFELKNELFIDTKGSFFWGGFGAEIFAKI